MKQLISPLSFALVVTIASTLDAQSPATKAVQLPAGIAGRWEGKSMIGPTDSVITTYVVMATTNAKGWTMKLQDRPTLPARVIAAGGDSVVTEIGPYSSVLRKGQRVTTRTTGHYDGDSMTGTFEAKFANGDVVHGKTTAKRTRKTP